MDYRQRRSKISLWPQTRPQAVRMAFYSMPLTIAAMTPAPKLRKRNGSVEFGCLYDPGTEPAWGPLAGVSWIAVRSARRTASIRAPMRSKPGAGFLLVRDRRDRGIGPAAFERFLDRGTEAAGINDRRTKPRRRRHGAGVEGCQW